MPQSISDSNKTDRIGKGPIHTIRYGAVRAAIWRNAVDNGNASRAMHNVTFSRSYKDRENNWKESANFSSDDLLLLAKAADEAHTWIVRQKAVDANLST